MKPLNLLYLCQHILRRECNRDVVGFDFDSRFQDCPVLPENSLFDHVMAVQIYTASDVRSHLFQLIDRIADEHEPICLMGENNQIVMISAEDYKSIQEGRAESLED